MIRVTLKSHKEAIEALERDGFSVEPIRFSRGDHLIVRVKREAGTGQVTLSGSPRGGNVQSVVGMARRAVRQPVVG